MLASFFQHEYLEAGCDEAGRGCLAGPVFAAAVILPPDYRHELMNDSKQLSAHQREALRKEIELDAVAWAVASVDEQEIDRINILNASIKAMNMAVEELKVQPGLLLIDGNRFQSHSGIPYRCFVNGDARFLSIAAASILAKTYRDDHMRRIGEEYPQYGWEKNKGYPTKAHREAIRLYGVTPYHRKTFTLLPVQLELDFKK